MSRPIRRPNLTHNYFFIYYFFGGLIPIFGYKIGPMEGIDKNNSILLKLSRTKEYTHLEFIPEDSGITYYLYSFEDGL